MSSSPPSAWGVLLAFGVSAAAAGLRLWQRRIDVRRAALTYRKALERVRAVRAGTTDELAVLRYCVQVLAERERTDPGSRGLWASKKKVALYFIPGRQRPRKRGPAWLRRVCGTISALACPPRIGSDLADVGRQPEGLTECQKDAIRRTHPLLQDTRVSSAGTCLYQHRQWYVDIRRKVARFAEAWTQQHQGHAARRT